MDEKTNVDNDIDIKEAASAMGKKGGANRSEKKVAAARENIQKAAGKKKGRKYPGIFDPERRLAALLKKSSGGGIGSDLSQNASVMGRKGGSSKSERKVAASRLNARGGIDGKGKHAGRPWKYQYTKQAQALLGVMTRYPCLIPDEVAENPQVFQGKTFPAFYKGADGKERRAKARIVSISDDEIILTHFYTRPTR